MPWFEEDQTVADPLPIQVLRLRQGDRLSAFAAIIEDEFGDPIDLADARAYITLRPLSPTLTADMLTRVELVIEGDGSEGLVTYDWQASQTLAAAPGSYEILVEVEYIAGANDGMIFRVPTQDQGSILQLGSSVAYGYLSQDAEGALVPDGLGGFEVA